VGERGSIPFGIALAILLVVTALTYRSTDASLETLNWVEHTHRVMEQLDTLSAAYSRAVTSRRSYVVAGDSSQLGEAMGLDARLAEAIAELRGLMNDNPRQLERLALYEALSKERIADLIGAVEERRATGKGVETAKGLALALRVRTVREAMDDEEKALLAERDSTTRVDLNRVKVAQVVGTCLSLFILLLAFDRLRREVRSRRRSEEALRKSEDRTARANQFLDSIVENLPDMIFVKDAEELRFERINRAGEELLGRPRASVLGKSDYELMPPAQAELFHARDLAALGGASVEATEESIETKAGERWVQTKRVPIVDPAGGGRYLLGITEDITERRRAEEALRLAKDATEAANRELEAFSYSVAHDLRAPLRSIGGFSQALIEDCIGQLDETGLGHLHRVISSAQAMGGLVDGLLALSRITRGELILQAVDLTALAGGIAARLKQESPQRSVEVVVHEGLVVKADKRLLTAAMENLLANAWKFTGKRDHARIEVGSLQENGASVYFVRDNGAGFEMAYVDKLFGAFQRLHRVTQFEGSGIGLATVQRIVQRHGGRIWATAAVDLGASFYFTFEPTRTGASNGVQHPPVG
jgi:PAS domain S-box-containing protein